MTIDEVKALLKSLTMAKRLVEVRQRQLEQCKEFTEVLKAVDYSKIRVTSSDNISSVERVAIRLETYQNKYIEACNKLFAIEDKIEKCMQCLTDIDKSLVIDRFMNDKSMLNISRNYCYSYDRLKHKYSEIYSKIGKYT